MTVNLMVVNIGLDTVDWDTWTVAKSAIIAVHEAKHGGGYETLAMQSAKCRVHLSTGEDLYCRNDYRALCEQLWPNSTGFVAQLQHDIQEAVGYLKTWAAEGCEWGKDCDPECDHKCSLPELRQFIRQLERDALT